jgi:hypothetical protein
MTYDISRFPRVNKFFGVQATQSDAAKTDAGAKSASTGIVGIAPSSGKVPPAVGTASPNAVPPHPSQAEVRDFNSAEATAAMERAIPELEAAIKQAEQDGLPAEQTRDARSLVNDARGVVNLEGADDRALVTANQLGEIRRSMREVLAKFERDVDARSFVDSANAPFAFAANPEPRK